MESGRSFSTGVGRALASSACFGRKAARQASMARGQCPVSSTAARIEPSAWKQQSGCRSKCSEASPSSPGALCQAFLNLRLSAPGRRGREASSGKYPCAPFSAPMR
eukprot:14843248-Alexandrium_andersonii.AAC.1